MNRRYGGIFLCLCGVSLLLCGCRKELCYDHDMHGLNVRVVVQPECTRRCRNGICLFQKRGNASAFGSAITA